jgi:hypothetical protein
MRSIIYTALLVLTLALPVSAQMDYQAPPDLELLHRPYDQLLDSYVRDGLVYYRALKMDRARLDHYVTSLGSATSLLASWDKPKQIAFWINAYNALVLEAAVNHYPAPIRKVPGAFDSVKYSVAGRMVTLDQIENTILAEYNDPRIYLALGRGGMDSGRLRSEAYSGPRLEAQLAQAAEQFAISPKYVQIDQLAGTVRVSPIFSWRSKAFVDAYADKAFALPGRTPIELAIAGFLKNYLLPAEREYLDKNSWKLVYMDFDWQLNDRAGVRH